MKRSDAINNLVLELYGKKTDLKSIGAPAMLIQAYKIMDAVEKIGMLPPVYMKKICSSNSGGSINVEVSEWEDEETST